MEIALNQKIDQREETILRFLPMVKNMVYRLAIHCPSFFDTEDLVETGIIGLITAVDTYDPARNASLKTYIHLKVRGAIYDELRKLSFLPRELYGKMKRVQEKFDEIVQATGCPPTLETLAQTLDLPQEELDEILTVLRTMAVVSLDQQNPGEEYSLVSCLACPRSRIPDEHIANEEQSEALARSIAELPDRERQVIVLYYYQELQLKEISELLGVSASRVSHLHSRALYRLNQQLSRNYFSEDPS